MYACDQQFAGTTLDISPQSAALCRGWTVVTAGLEDQSAFHRPLPGLLDPAAEDTAVLLVVGSLYQSTRRNTAIVFLSPTVRSSNRVA